MLDLDEVISAELEQLAPESERRNPDWGDAQARAREPLRQQRRRRLWIAVPAIALVVVTPTIALSANVRTLLGISSPRPVVTKARLVISAPVGNDFYAHLWNSPSTTGGQCSFTSLDHRATPAPIPVENGGGGCSYTGTRPLLAATAASPLTIGVAIERRLKVGDPRKWVPPVVSGNVLPALHVTRVQIEWRHGSYRLKLQNNYILGGTPKLYMPPFADFPFYAVAYCRCSHPCPAQVPGRHAPRTRSRRLRASRLFRRKRVGDQRRHDRSTSRLNRRRASALAQRPSMLVLQGEASRNVHRRRELLLHLGPRGRHQDRLPRVGRSRDIP